MPRSKCRTTPGAPVYLSIIEQAPSMVMARVGMRPLNDRFSEPYDFFSPHPGVTQFVFADGSVHNIKYGIDPQTFNALGHRDDGTNLHSDPDNIQ